MGGCKCTYKGCSRSSDSVTHFFHYPVRDEERCLFWMQNAQRLEFKSLTKSQLANKVICQYHFKNSMFMNYKHDRLVPRAVPGLMPDEPTNPLVKYECSVPPTKQTDVQPPVKEDSIMSVNMSPILGLSFIAPPERRSRNVSSYVELLTRKTRGRQTVIANEKNHNSSSKKDVKIFPNRLPDHVLENVDPLQLDSSLIIVDNAPALEMNIPIPAHNLTEKTASEQSANPEVDNLFKTPPKKLKTSIPISPTYTISKKRQSQSPVLYTIGQLTPICNTENQNGVFNIISNETITSPNPQISTLNDKAAQVNIINKQLLLYNQQNDIYEKRKKKNSQTKVTTVEKTSPIPPKIVAVDAENDDYTLPPAVTHPNLLKTNSPAKDVPITECIKLINKNSKEISELKRMLLAQKTDKRSISKSRPSSKSRKISKSYLYAQIVPYLSPELAKKVHKEMFPNLFRRKIQ